MESLISRIVDDSAEQAKLFLGLDKESSTTIIDEILEEKDVVSKLGKLLRLLIDRLKFQEQKNRDKIKITSLYENVQKIDTSVPDSISKFLTWIPDKILSQNQQIKELKRALRKSEKKQFANEEIIGEITEKVNKSQKKLKSRIVELEEENNALRHLVAIKDVSEHKLEETEKLVSQLKSANSSLEKKIFDLHVSINNISKENEALRQKETEKKVIFNYEEVDKAALISEIESLQTRLKKTERIQTKSLKRKSHGRRHKHEYYSSSEESYCSSDSESSSSSFEEKKRRHHKKSKCCSCCKCRCHKLDINSLKNKFDALESDVDDLHYELSRNLKQK